MNERLKQEYKAYQSEEIEKKGYLDLAGFAEHFYNLAIEDIKKLIEYKIEMNRNDWERGYWIDSMDQLVEIYEQVENLNKA